MVDAESPGVGAGAAVRLLVRSTERTAFRRLARSPILSVHTNVAQSFGPHWTIGRKPWKNLGAPTRSVSKALWVMAWETLEPGICAAAERRDLVRDKPA